MRSLPLLIALSLASTGPAYGQTAAEEREAKVQIATGLDHYRAGQYRDAVTAFRRAYELLPDAESTLTWNIARSYEELGDVTNAVHYFEVFLKRYPDDDSIEDGRKRLGKLRLRLPGSLTVHCGDGRAAKVLVGAEREGACGVKIANVPPGDHPVVVRWGKRTWKGEATVIAAGDAEVTVDWDEATEPAPPPAKADDKAAKPTRKKVAARAKRGWTTSDWLVTGGVVAGALLVGAAAAYAVVQPGRVEVPSTDLGERTVLEK